MNKKIFFLLLITSCFFVGCEQRSIVDEIAEGNALDSSSIEGKVSNVESSTTDKNKQFEDIINITEESTENNETDSDLVDLTVLSSTMVYAEVFRMMYEPEVYVGKTVKMNGQFYVYSVTETGPYFYACVIQDATACCQQGIEFILQDESLIYPDDYPEMLSMITVTGTFELYDDGEYTYCRLKDAQIEGDESIEN